LLLPELVTPNIAVQRVRTMTLETIAPLRDDPIARLPAVAA
jgi:hypothetical protein